jgi:acetyl-CoA carboxylase biotin carboxyl carrier protein
MSRHSVKAGTPGTVLMIDVSVGDRVSADQVVVRLEIMKMEIPVETPVGGRVISIHVQTGDIVAEGHLLVTIETP